MVHPTFYQQFVVLLDAQEEVSEVLADAAEEEASLLIRQRLKYSLAEASLFADADRNDVKSCIRELIVYQLEEVAKEEGITFDQAWEHLTVEYIRLVARFFVFRRNDFAFYWQHRN